MAAPHAFLDILANPQVRDAYLAGRVSIILSSDLETILWANGAGARFMGFRTVAEAIGVDSAFDRLTRLQIEAGLTASRAVRVGGIPQGESFLVTSGDVPPLGNVVFLRSVAASAGGRGVDLTDGLSDESTEAAVLDIKGEIMHSSPNFKRELFDTAELAEVAEQAHRDGDVKKRFLKKNSDIPVGVLELSVEPPIFLMIAAKLAMSGTGGGADDGQEFVYDPARLPLRFGWEVDGAGRFIEVSSELVAAVGPRFGDIMGKTFAELATEWNMDANGAVRAMFTSHNAWSGRKVYWPVEGGEQRVEIEFFALPVYSRAREFIGFRGFGIINDAKIATQSEATLEAKAPPAKGLSPQEHEAFSAIARKLRADILAIDRPTSKDKKQTELFGQSFAKEAAPKAREHKVLTPAATPEAVEKTDDKVSDVASYEPPVAGDIAAIAEGLATISAGADATPDGARANIASDRKADADSPVAAKPDTTVADALKPGALTPDALASVVAEGALKKTVGQDHLALDGDVVADAHDYDDEQGPPAWLAGDIEPVENNMSGDNRPLTPKDDGTDAATSFFGWSIADDGSLVNDNTGDEGVKRTPQEAVPVGAQLDDGAGDGAQNDGTSASFDRSSQAGGLTAAGRDAVEISSLTKTVAAETPAPERSEHNAAQSQGGSADIERLRPDTALHDLDAAADIDFPTNEMEALSEALSTAVFIGDKPQIGSIAEDDAVSDEGNEGAEAPVTSASVAAAAFSSTDDRVRDDKADDDKIRDDKEDLTKAEPHVEEAEEAAASSPHIELALLQQVPLATLIYRDNRVLFASDQLLGMTGFPSLDSFRAHGVLSAILREWLPKNILIGPNGEAINIRPHMRGVTWSDGVPASLISFVPEEANNKALEEEFEALQHKAVELSVLLNLVSDGVFILDPAGVIHSVNDAAVRMFALLPDELKGQVFTRFFSDQNHEVVTQYFHDFRQEGFRQEIGEGREVEAVAANGQKLSLHVSFGRMELEQGYFLMMRDLTPLQKVASELVRARFQAEEDSRRKSRYLAFISHEIRTPLNAVIGLSQLMLEEKYGPMNNDRYRNYLRDIVGSGEHIMTLINDLLDAAKSAEGRTTLDIRPVALIPILNEVLGLMTPQANSGRIIMRSSIASDLPFIQADARSVKQIILNLLSNAIRFTPQGGQIIVSALQQVPGEVLLRIRDTGVGMSQVEMEEAMKPYRQVERHDDHREGSGAEQGTGLGLPLTKALSEANHAQFILRSQPGQGTVAEVVFTAAPRQASENGAKSTTPPTSGSSAHVAAALPNQSQFAGLSSGPLSAPVNRSTLAPSSGATATVLSSGGPAFGPIPGPAPIRGGVAPTPAPSGMAPSPAPSGMASSPAPSGMAPPPAPSGMAPQPAPSGMAPPPAPSGMAPPPAPSGMAPSPAPSGMAPSPAPSGMAPPPAPSGMAPPPAPAPIPRGSTSMPADAKTGEQAEPAVVPPVRQGTIRG